LYYHFKKGGPSNQRLNRNELLLHKATQSNDSKQLANAILKYALVSSITTRITHMEGEKIFGSCKWKPNLLSRTEGDLHRYDHVNFSRPRVNTHIGKSHVQIEQPSCNVNQYEVVDITNGSVEILEPLCKLDGMWHIE
jgi:hypothetical protein